jgi:hypothetical protein
MKTGKKDMYKTIVKRESSVVEDILVQIDETLAEVKDVLKSQTKFYRELTTMRGLIINERKRLHKVKLNLKK